MKQANLTKRLASKYDNLKASLWGKTQFNVSKLIHVYKNADITFYFPFLYFS